jgi:hypothetical protein
MSVKVIVTKGEWNRDSGDRIDPEDTGTLKDLPQRDSLVSGTIKLKDCTIGHRRSEMVRICTTVLGAMIIGTEGTLSIVEDVQDTGIRLFANCKY